MQATQSPTKHWQIAAHLSAEAAVELSGYPPILRQILYNRGCCTRTEAENFLRATPPPGTEPSGMSGIGAALERIQSAIHKQEPIAVYGDYDADGVTATALLTLVLQSLGADVRPYIPNRFDEGYGLNKDALESLQAQGVRLVITVDCGIRSLEEADYAAHLGLDLIITDHHQPAQDLPRARAIINPKQPQDTYPYKDLAGVGLAYKLAQALLPPHNGVAGIPAAESYLDLVALGTIADLVPLRDENRALVRAGLRQMRASTRQGVVSLTRASGLNPQRMTAGHVGFILAPRINAAGRLESALAALQLLTDSSEQTTGLLAQKLDDQNRERQRLTQHIQQRAEEIVQQRNPEALLLFAYHPDFNPGVVGLAASRLLEEYYRPAIVAYQGEQFTRGSCRSIPEFHITQALDECEDLLEHHGGHRSAAGFTVRNEHLPELIERLEAIALRELSDRVLRPTLKADVEITLTDVMADIQNDLLKRLDLLQPTGIDNPQPVFVSRGLQIVYSKGVGRDGGHLKLRVSDGKTALDAIAFRQGRWLGQLPERVDLMYMLEENEFNGNTSLQLNVKDLRPSD